MTSLCSSEGWHGHAGSSCPSVSTKTSSTMPHSQREQFPLIPKSPNMRAGKVIQAQCRKSPNMPDIAAAEQRSVHQPPCSGLGVPTPQTVPRGSTESFYLPVVSPPAPPPARPISEFNTWCRALGRDERCFLTSNLVKSLRTLASR